MRPESNNYSKLGYVLVLVRMVEHLLCPIRTLLWYQSRTKVIRGNQEHMFVCYAPGHLRSAASPTMVARWICDAVKTTHLSLAVASLA